MLINKTSGYVAFKVKTTAPKSYLVRLSAATLGPHSREEVTIILQPPGEGQNHRFLVQAVQVTSSQPVSRDQWSEFKKEQIEEQRLNVVLEACAPCLFQKRSDVRNGNSKRKSDIQVNVLRYSVE